MIIFWGTVFVICVVLLVVYYSKADEERSPVDQGVSTRGNRHYNARRSRPKINSMELAQFIGSPGHRYLIIDLETNGFAPPTSVLSLSAWLIDTSSPEWKVLKAIDRYYFPLEEINPKAAAVNGLFHPVLVKKRKTAKYPALFIEDHQVRAFLETATHVVGHNLSFDLQWIPSLAGKPCFDTMTMNTEVIRIPKEGGGLKWPKLIEAARFYRIPVVEENLHQGSYDVELTARVFLAMVVRSGRTPVPSLVVEGTSDL